MESLQRIIEAVKSSPGGVDAVAVEAGVSVHTLIKVVNGATKNPRYETFCKLDEWHKRQATQ